MFETLLENGVKHGLTFESALEILQASREPQNALLLFAAAAQVRDRMIGKKLWWSAGIPGVMPCKVTPRCTYCTFYTTEAFPLDGLKEAVKVIEQLGLKQFHLSGGSNLAGYDGEILAMVEAIRSVSDIDVEVNLGPSISLDTIKALKQMNVISITSSLETINEEVFARAKPGDSLEGRKALLDYGEKEGVSLRSMMLVGLGETEEDRIRHLFYLKNFKHLYHLRFSRFYPFPKTRHQALRCSPWEVARLVAVARLILPHVQLGLAAGNEKDDLPLWYLAGGGNQILGTGVSRKPVEAGPEVEVIRISEDLYVVNRMPLQKRYMAEMNREVVFDCPSHY